MTTLTGFLTPSPSGTQQDRSLSLRPIQTYQGLTRLKLHVESQAGLASFGTKTSLTTHQPGYVTPSFYTHFYNRIAIIPNAFELGAISTEQALTVQVWNAWLTPQQLLSITIDNGEGIHLSGPETPILFSRLNIKKWQITVSEEGPPVVDCVITWHFAGLPPVSLKITGSRSALWLFTPDWVEGVTETLEWKTELLQSQTGAEQRRAMRLTPRRTFEFKVLLANVERQRFDNLVSVYGQRAWSLPLWHDAGYLQYVLNAGSNVIVIDTAGRDFQAGGVAILRQNNVTEAVEIQRVLPDSLVLARPILGSFLPGAVIYPTRSAVFTDPPSIKRLTDGVGSAQLGFRVTEHNAGTGILSVQDDDSASTENAPNEIIVTYHDPVMNNTGQARIQNLASIQAHGVISTTADYKAIPTYDLAARVGQRDLEMGSAGLTRLKIKFDRRGGQLAPASVFRVNLPDRDIENMVMRVGRLTESDDGSFIVVAIQDVFGLPATNYNTEQPPVDWTPPDRTALPVLLPSVLKHHHLYLLTIFYKPGQLEPIIRTLPPVTGHLPVLFWKR